MSNLKPSDKPTTAEGSGPPVYDTATSTGANRSGPGVYEAPSRSGGLPVGMIVGAAVVLLILAFLLFQFVF